MINNGSQLRDKGIKKAVDNANDTHEKWSDKAYKFLVGYIKSHQEFSEKYSLPFPILADVDKGCAEDYGVLGKFMMMTIAKRQSFIINPECEIVKHYKKVNSDSHSEEVINDLKQLGS